MNKRVFMGLDIGSRRIGVAVGDSIGRIAQPLTTLINDDSLKLALNTLIGEHDVTDIVVGRPLDQTGAETEQTSWVRSFVDDLGSALPVHWQDESVTSIVAEDRLKKRGKPYTKAAIDAEAASVILQDYLDGAL